VFLVPRGRKNLSLDEQLQEIDNQLSTLQSRREELVAKKHEEDMQVLARFMAENNMSAAQVISLISPSIV
jgi:cytochrome c553